MIDGSEKRNRQLAFELQNSHVCEKRSKLYYKVYQHEIDNFKLIAEIHVLASETFKTKLC